MSKLSKGKHQFKDIHDRRTNGKRNALHRATRYNDIKCMKILIEAGSETDKKDTEGRTPLRTAINKKYNWDNDNASNPLGCEAIMLLLDSGASIENLDFHKENEQHKYEILQKCVDGNNNCC